MSAGGWVVVVPVKPLSVAKSRLRGAAAGVPHEDLVFALVLDTVAAALACPRVAEVIIVTDDPALSRLPGVRVLADTPAAGLNAALRYGARAALGRPVAALTGDLPALRPAELTEALDRADEAFAGAGDAPGRPRDRLRSAAASTVRPWGRAFVTDAAGTGTTLLAGAAGEALDPRFGPGSASAHRRSGATPLRGSWPGLRRDVDTAHDLTVAADLGVGPATAAVLGLVEAVRRAALDGPRGIDPLAAVEELQ